MLIGILLLSVGVFVGLMLPYEVNLGRANIKQMKFTKENREQIMDAVKRSRDLTGEEVGLLLSAMVRDALGSGVVEGETVGDVIETEREFTRNEEARAQEEKRRANARAQEERRLAEGARRKEEALAAALRSHLSVVLYEKGFREKDIYAGQFNDYITVKVALENRGDKPIKAFRGTFVFKDLFGKEIYSISLYSDEGLKPKQKKTKVYSIEYNQFVDAHEKLRFTSLSNMRVEWKPQTILFADGTKLGE